MSDPESINSDPPDRPLPPYEGRRQSADMTPEEDTPGGAETAPADEQPASGMPETDMDPDMVGPAHEEGTPRGEDRPKGTG